MKELLLHDIETISRLSHLINNLLLLSKTEAMQANFESEPLRLDDILRDVEADGRVLAEAKSQRLMLSNLPEVMIRGDSMRLYQLFFNLVDNAIKYSPEGSAIELWLGVHTPWAIVGVKDNGVGIAPEHIPHLFDRFYRVQKDRARKTGGSGLGLAICKLIAELHHGTIDVTSVVGKGSTFIVKLPLLKS